MAETNLLAFLFSGMALACALLLWSGATHLRHAGRFKAALQDHRILPPEAIGAVARAFPWLAVLVGSSGALTLILYGIAIPGLWFEVAAGAVAVLYAVLAAYLAVQIHVAPDSPCGCFGDRKPPTWRMVGQNLLLCGASLFSALLSPTTG